jgi:hypothetical protein
MRLIGVAPFKTFVTQGPQEPLEYVLNRTCAVYLCQLALTTIKVRHGLSLRVVFFKTGVYRLGLVIVPLIKLAPAHIALAVDF